jgi:hypothetical protein
MLRYLRMTAAVACFLLCLLFVVLFARSYWYSDAAYVCRGKGTMVTNLNRQRTPTYRMLSASTSHGTLSVVYNDNFHDYFFNGSRVPEGVYYHSNSAGKEEWWFGRTTLGFGRLATPSGDHAVAMPFEFLIFTSGAVGALLWMKRPYRFTMLGMFVTMTLVALVLGIGAACCR